MESGTTLTLKDQASMTVFTLAGIGHALTFKGWELSHH